MVDLNPNDGMRSDTNGMRLGDKRYMRDTETLTEAHLALGKDETLRR